MAPAFGQTYVILNNEQDLFQLPTFCSIVVVSLMNFSTFIFVVKLVV